MSWICANIIPVLNIAGLVFDMIGAVLVAIEVVNQFRGQQYGGHFSFDRDLALPPSETDQYKAWARRRMRAMKIGLGCLVLGFLLQAVANVLQLKRLPRQAMQRPADQLVLSSSSSALL